MTGKKETSTSIDSPHNATVLGNSEPVVIGAEIKKGNKIIKDVYYVSELAENLLVKLRCITL